MHGARLMEQVIWDCGGAGRGWGWGGECVQESLAWVKLCRVFLFKIVCLNASSKIFTYKKSSL